MLVKSECKGPVSASWFTISCQGLDLIIIFSNQYPTQGRRKGKLIRLSYLFLAGIYEVDKNPTAVLKYPLCFTLVREELGT